MEYDEIAKNDKSKMRVTSFGNIEYNGNEKINEDDILRLEYARRITFNNFSENIDELPDNITEIMLSDRLAHKINKIPQKLKYLYMKDDNIELSLLEQDSLKKISIAQNSYERNKGAGNNNLPIGVIARQEREIILKNPMSINIEELIIECVILKYDFNILPKKLKKIKITCKNATGKKIEVPNNVNEILLNIEKKKNNRIINFLPTSLEKFDDNVFMLTNNSLGLPNKLRSIKFECNTRMVKISKNINNFKVTRPPNYSTFNKIIIKIRYGIEEFSSGNSWNDKHTTILKFYHTDNRDLSNTCCPGPPGLQSRMALMPSKRIKMCLYDDKILIENKTGNDLFVENINISCNEIKVNSHMNFLKTNHLVLSDAGKFKSGPVINLNNIMCRDLKMDRMLVDKCNEIGVPFVTCNFDHSLTLGPNTDAKNDKFIKDVMGAALLSKINACIFENLGHMNSACVNTNIIEIFPDHKYFSEYISKKNTDYKITQNHNGIKDINFDGEQVITHANLFQFIEINRRKMKQINMNAIDSYSEKINNAIDIMQYSNNKPRCFKIMTNHLTNDNSTSSGFGGNIFPDFLIKYSSMIKEIHLLIKQKIPRLRETSKNILYINF